MPLTERARPGRSHLDKTERVEPPMVFLHPVG